MMKEALSVTTGHYAHQTQHFIVARYAIDVAHHRRPLPSITDTLLVAERVRATLMGIYQRMLHTEKHGSGEKPYQERFFSQSFSGKDAGGRPLQGHRHCFFLPADEDGDGRIDHVTIVAEKDFTPDELRALDRLRQVRHGDGDPLRLLLVGLGSERHMKSPLFAESQTWVSATPFLASRYPKLRGTKRDRPEDYATPRAFAAHVLRQELDRLRERRPNLPTVVGIEPLEGLGPHGSLRPIQFRRFRDKPGDDGGRRPAGAFRVHLAAPVQGPLCLGHSCHFGLGLLRGEDSGIGQS
jgi:CRISPR-associated protein Csb2